MTLFALFLFSRSVEASVSGLSLLPTKDQGGQEREDQARDLNKTVS